MGNRHGSKHPENVWASPSRDVKNSWREEHQRVFKQILRKTTLLGDLCLWNLWDVIFRCFFLPPAPHQKIKPSWWFQPLWKIIRQNGNLPQVSGWKKKIFELPPPRNLCPHLSASWSLKIGSPSRAVLDVFARNTYRPRVCFRFSYEMVATEVMSKKQGFQAEKAAKSTSQRRMNYCITIGWHIIAGNRTRNYTQIQLVESNLINKGNGDSESFQYAVQWAKKTQSTESSQNAEHNISQHLCHTLDLLLVSCKSLVTRSISSSRTAKGT